ncbi:MAG: hypothetical protein KDK78_00380 [Chlamydiia bacterium]|nr:hypothetical protein [Chlamydiia bacterium]
MDISTASEEEEILLFSYFSSSAHVELDQKNLLLFNGSCAPQHQIAESNGYDFAA